MFIVELGMYKMIGCSGFVGLFIKCDICEFISIDFGFYSVVFGVL